MLSRFFRSKLFLVFSILFVACFFIGYDYAVITSKDAPAAAVKAPAAMPSGQDAQQTDPEEEGE